MDGPFDLTDSLVSLASRTPLIATLLVGLVVCYRQRKLRPRASWLFGVALVCELLLSTVGWELYARAMSWMGFGFSDVTDYGDPAGNESDSLKWMLRLVMYYLPASTISAVIWSCTLWATLMIDDFRTSSNKSEG